MPPYAYNRNCACARCRIHGLMGPAMIVTTGMIWLLDEFTRISIRESWPVYLLVIGGIILGSRTASMEGHAPLVARFAGTPAQYQYPAQNPGQAMTGNQPPPPPATESASMQQDAVQTTDQQVKP
jgi:hypothetical protein